MRLESMGQLAVAVKESLKTLTLDNNTENGNSRNALSTQTRYIDSVELSERAIQLSRQAEAETAVEVKPATVQREKAPAANPLQDVFTKALALNALA